MIPLTPPQSLINVPDHVLRNESDRGFTRIFQAVNQINQHVGLFADAEIPEGAIDGVNTRYTLAHDPIPSSLKAFLSGLLQSQGGTGDYALVAKVMTFAIAPPVNSNLITWYRYL